MRVKSFYIVMCCFLNFAFANPCDQLNSENIWKQVIVGREKNIVVWPNSKTESRVTKGSTNLVGPWIQKMIRLKIFDQFELKIGEIYTFPIQSTISRLETKMILSVQLRLLKKSQGVTIIELSNLKNSDAEESLKSLGALSLSTQNQFVAVAENIFAPAALLDYLSISQSAAKILLTQLFKTTDALNQIKDMPFETELTVVRPEIILTGKQTSYARRIVFFKDLNGLIRLIAIED